MEKRHQDTLTTRLEDAYLNGMAHISKEELKFWYGVQKVAARTIRDVETRWSELTEDSVGRLMTISARGGFFIFAEKYISSFSQDESED